MAAWEAKLSSSASSSAWKRSAPAPRVITITPRTSSPMTSGWAMAWRTPSATNSGRASGEFG